MFYYYGRKARIAHLYPDPQYGSIIEPFAGSAAYSLHGNRWQNNVYLYDINPTVIGIWQYLLQATEQDILNLPNPERYDDIRNIQTISVEERNLIGLAINPGSASPCNIVGRFSRWNANKKYIVDNLHKVKHWKVLLSDYTTIPNDFATWFIDPPYQVMGKHYKKSEGMNYEMLSKWIQERNGQIIACEGINATYLPFVPLCELKAIGTRTTKEFIYIQDSYAQQTGV